MPHEYRHTYIMYFIPETSTIRRRYNEIELYFVVLTQSDSLVGQSFAQSLAKFSYTYVWCSYGICLYNNSFPDFIVFCLIFFKSAL